MQREYERVVIGGADADGVEIGEFAGGVGFGVFEDVKLIAEFGAEGGSEHATVREDKIVRGDGVVIGPAGIRAEVKRPRESIA